MSFNEFNEQQNRPQRRFDDDIDFLEVNGFPIPISKRMGKVVSIIFFILFGLAAVGMCVFFIISCMHQQPVRAVGHFVVIVAEDSPTHSHTIKGRIENITNKELTDVTIEVQYSVVLDQVGKFLSAKQTGVTIAPKAMYNFTYSGETEYEGVMRISLVSVTVGEETYVVQS